MTSGLLFVGNFLSASTAHRHYCEDLADRIERRNWHVVRTSKRMGRFARFADMVGVTWRRRGEYQIAHVDLFSNLGFTWAEVVCFELLRLNKPFILTLRGGSLPEFADKWPRRMARLLESAAAVTAPSSYMRDAMTAHASNIAVIPNALDIARYPFRCREAVEPKLVWLRAFHRVYNPVLAVEVLGRLLVEQPLARLEMIGPDREDGSLLDVQRRARELGVDHRLTISPGIPKLDVGTRLASADIFINTTDFDNAPVTVLEAMACGLCVVSTNVGGIPHLLANRRNSLLVPPRDVDAMVGAINELVAQPALASAISATARDEALAFDWPRVLEQWDSLLQRVSS